MSVAGTWQCGVFTLSGFLLISWLEGERTGEGSGLVASVGPGEEEISNVATRITAVGETTLYPGLQPRGLDGGRGGEEWSLGRSFPLV